MRRCQPLQHPLHGPRQPVVHIVAARPERVAAGLGREGVDLEHGVVGRHRLKRDVAVPSRAGEAAGVRELVRQPAALGLLLGRDDADLVAQLAVFLR